MSGPGTPASAPVLPEPKWRSEMPKRTCSLDDCTSPVYGRGWCKTHWQRWYRTGDPTGIRPGRWDGYGYDAVHLATDHEAHYRFDPR